MSLTMLPWMLSHLCVIFSPLLINTCLSYSVEASVPSVISLEILCCRSCCASKRHSHACVWPCAAGEKAKLSTMLSTPVMEFPVFNPLPDASFLDCILGNGKPQSCNHQSVSWLHAKLQLTQKDATLLKLSVVPVRPIRVLCWSSFAHSSVFDDQLKCVFHLTCCHIPLQASVSHRRLLCVALNNSPLAMCSPALYITEAVNATRQF